MTPKSAFPTLSRVLFDFLLGLVLFAAIASLTCGGDIATLSAHAGGLAWPPEFAAFDVPPPAELRNGGGALHLPALVTLGVALASTFALNLWFVRHVSRVYASTRRGGQNG